MCHGSGGVETEVHEAIADGQEESGEVGVVPAGDVGVVPETAADMPHAEDVQTVLKRTSFITTQPTIIVVDQLHNVLLQKWLMELKNSMPSG